MDISEDGKYLVTTSFGNEVRMWDITNPNPTNFTLVDSPSERGFILGGMKWFSRHGTFSPDCIGNNSTYKIHLLILTTSCYRLGAYASYGRNLDITTMAVSTDNRLLLAGDVFGALNLLKNPSTVPFAPKKLYHGHTPGGISRVAFSGLFQA
jgi:hypothetical protein